MSIYHDEVEIEDFEYDEETETYYFPCPCGDKFQITKEELQSGEDVAKCPSCSLMVKVIYDIDEFLEEEEVIPAPKVEKFLMEQKGPESAQQSSAPSKDVATCMKTKIKCDPVCSKDSDLPVSADLVNPSVLDEVLAEKKLALMRSPEVIKFLQSQQKKVAKQMEDKEMSKEEEDGLE